MEEWKAIEGYEGLYEVSNMGNVKSLPRHGTKGGLLIPRIDCNGYAEVGLMKNAKRKNQKIHLLVAKYFVENPENKPYVDHKDQIKHNNFVGNLRWATRSENGFNRTKVWNGTSKYKGVYWYKSRNKWRASIRINDKSIHLGQFDTEEEGAKAYDSYIIQHLADFGILNFPK
jgi:hypothetical protein